MPATIELAAKQKAAANASQRMLQMLLGFEPCRVLTVGDVKFIADWTQTCAFDAINEAEQSA